MSDRVLQQRGLLCSEWRKFRLCAAKGRILPNRVLQQWQLLCGVFRELQVSYSQVWIVSDWLLQQWGVLRFDQIDQSSFNTATKMIFPVLSCFALVSTFLSQFVASLIRLRW